MEESINRKDLENVLDKLENISTELNGVLEESFIETMDAVISEYSYFITDVEELYDDRERLQGLVDEAELED